MHVNVVTAENDRGWVVQTSVQFQFGYVQEVGKDAGISLEAGLASDLVMPKNMKCSLGKVWRSPCHSWPQRRDTADEEKKGQFQERMRGRKTEREWRQARQGTYTEGTATLFPSPPLLYKHREDTHTHTHSATKYTKVVVTNKTGEREERGAG